MAGARRRDIHLNSNFVEARGNFEYEIGPFAETIDDTTAAFITRFISCLADRSERPLLGFCPLIVSDLPPSIGWHVIHRRERSAGHLPFLIGYADNTETFRHVFHAAWNSAMNEPVIAVIARNDDLGDMFASADRAGEVYQGNEQHLLQAYPTVVSRYFDGLSLRVLSRQLSPETVADHLDDAERGDEA